MPPKPTSSEVTSEMKCAQILAPPRPPAQTNSAQTFDLSFFFALLSVLSASALGFLRFFLALKIKMIMVATSRIKPRPAPRTPRRAIQILPNRHLHPASPTQNRPLLPLPPPPNRNRMPRQRNMAILASIVDPATPHLNRHNVHRRPVVHTPRLRVEIKPTNLWTLFHKRHLGRTRSGVVMRQLGPSVSTCSSGEQPSHPRRSC